MGIATWLFVITGGIGLVRLYQNYLTQDVPDKKYSYADFTERGPREMLHGYYGGRVGDTIFIWTFSGLKHFRHQQGTSVYYYMDVCGIVRQLAQQKKSGESMDEEKKGRLYDEMLTFELDQWAGQTQAGDYVWVKRVGEGAESKIIDKVWANSNQYYPVERVTEEQCKE
ncbi:MAG: hypothetical protein EDM79_14725 [Chloroflexi bacterium]|nr:MAG: hypothetical protein EDM79_14725 [Chloroflexota bacterium]